MNISYPPESGECSGKPTEWWFPLVHNGVAVKRFTQMANKRRAVAVCNTCSVKEQCLDYALANEMYGIWGGKDERERGAIRQKRGVPPIRVGATVVPQVVPPGVSPSVQSYK